MSIPTDPGASILDNNGEAILNQGSTGIAKRLDNLYAKFSADIGQDNLKLSDNYAWTGNHSFAKAFSAKIPGLISNAQLSLSAGVLSLVGENSGAPSSTNPVYIRRVDSAGRWETLTFTSATYCSIQDSASADSYFYNGVAGTPWGTTSGTAWASSMPLFIYVGTAALSANPCLFLSRKPNLTSASGLSIGYANNPPSSAAESNLFAWTSNDVTISHADASLTFIGYIVATKNNSNDWTFSGVSSVLSGILNYNFEHTNYTMPTGQNGAASGSYFSVSAGTAPTYTGSNSYTYRMDRSGNVRCVGVFTNVAAGTAGAGAAQLILSTPLASSNCLIGQGLFINNTFGVYAIPVNSSGNRYDYSYNTAVGAANMSYAQITGDLQNNATRSIFTRFSFIA